MVSPGDGLPTSRVIACALAEPLAAVVGAEVVAAPVDAPDEVVGVTVFWLVPVGVLLGVTLNLANSLPDIEEDAAAGAKTLAVVLGVERSFLVCRFFIVVGALLMAILTAARIVPALPSIIVPILIFTSLSVGSMFLFFGPEKPVPTRKVHFYVAALTCMVLAGGWLIGVLV